MNQKQLKNIFNYDLSWIDKIEDFKDNTEHHYFRHKSYNICKCGVIISDSDLKLIAKGDYEKKYDNIYLKFTECHDIIRCDMHIDNKKCSGYEIDCHQFHDTYVDELRIEECDYL